MMFPNDCLMIKLVFVRVHRYSVYTLSAFFLYSTLISFLIIPCTAYLKRDKRYVYLSKQSVKLFNVCLMIKLDHAEVH